jgi:hypothetical protein
LLEYYAVECTTDPIKDYAILNCCHRYFYFFSKITDGASGCQVRCRVCP